jgi:serine/threonine protein kinase
MASTISSCSISKGETLASRLHGGPLPIAEALKYASQIAHAIDAAHKRGITHRDLKPSNVMLTKVGAVLLDFGLAKLSDCPMHRIRRRPSTSLATAPSSARSAIWRRRCSNGAARMRDRICFPSAPSSTK